MWSVDTVCTVLLFHCELIARVRRCDLCAARVLQLNALQDAERRIRLERYVIDLVTSCGNDHDQLYSL